jgi:hypothetical protein
LFIIIANLFIVAADFLVKVVKYLKAKSLYFFYLAATLVIIAKTFLADIAIIFFLL